MVPFYSSVHNTRTLKKWDSAIINFIIYTCACQHCLPSDWPTVLSPLLLWAFDCVVILILIERRSTWVQLHSRHDTAGLQSTITLACFLPLKKQLPKLNPPPAEESMEFLSESHLMVQQALMQSQYKLSYRSSSMWLCTHWSNDALTLAAQTKTI